MGRWAWRDCAAGGLAREMTARGKWAAGAKRGEGAAGGTGGEGDCPIAVVTDVTVIAAVFVFR